ncbi:glutamate 5-kinase [Rhizobium calliandrae]|uniref:Glutamate 5-kinase n=1 Tax=Rhizobium calliandrae TaxID=1312182 RepID=A0ABT7KR49_9HYPH|nr:glutamate 5-kinase [Rhizobium calliandrae]MDL2410433.1 glutamate 5-kinase [Rhizobium calliandrae]
MNSFLVQQDSAPTNPTIVQLSSATRLVVKVGSALIADTETGEIRAAWLDTLIEDVIRFIARGQQVIIVSSGAVAVGSRHIGELDKRLRTGMKHAAAAIGQVQIMRAYEQSLKRRGFGVGEVLLSSEDLDDQQRRLNNRGTLQQLFQVGAVPVINENDTTATTGICVGDNDRLAARVAQMVDAGFLIVLSDVDGLFTEDPHGNPLARLVTEVRCITPEIEAMAASSPARYGVGGMVTKLIAAKIAMDAGCAMIIAKGSKSYPLTAIERGGPSTRFIPLNQYRGTYDVGTSQFA